MNIKYALSVVEDSLHGVLRGDLQRSDLNATLIQEALQTLRERTNPEYDPQDSAKRLDFFYDAYSCVPDVPKPASYSIDLDDYDYPDEVVPDDEVWLQNAAHHASIALMDALAGLIDISNDKTLEGAAEEDLMEGEDDEGLIFDDEA